MNCWRKVGFAPQLHKWSTAKHVCSNKKQPSPSLIREVSCLLLVSIQYYQTLVQVAVAGLWRSVTGKWRSVTRRVCLAAGAPHGYTLCLPSSIIVSTFTYRLSDVYHLRALQNKFHLTYNYSTSKESWLTFRSGFWLKVQVSFAVKHHNGTYYDMFSGWPC